MGGRMPPQNEVYAESARIGQQLNAIAGKIEQLKQLNKKKGLFDDTTTQFGSVTAEITDNTARVDQLLAALDARANELAGRANTRHASESARNAVQALKLRHTQNMQDFFQAVQTRKDTEQKKQTRRRQQTSSRYPGRAHGVGMGSDYMDGESDQNPLITGSGYAAQGRIQGGNSVLYAERANAMEQVQRSISEMAQMFKQFREMVESQQSLVMRIDDNVDQSALHINTGNEELAKYLKYIQGNRSLLIKMFIIVLFFIVVYVVLLT